MATILQMDGKCALFLHVSTTITIRWSLEDTESINICYVNFHFHNLFPIFFRNWFFFLLNLTNRTEEALILEASIYWCEIEMITVSIKPQSIGCTKTEWWCNNSEQLIFWGRNSHKIFNKKYSAINLLQQW